MVARDAARWRALLQVDHPDSSVRTRATNALVVLYGVVGLGAASTIPLFTIPGGTIAGITCVAVTVLALVSAVLVRTGHTEAGLTLFFTALMGGNLAAPLVGHDARLTAVYLAIPVAIAGVTLPRSSVFVVTLAAIVMAVWGTLAFPPVDPPPDGPEIITAGVIVISAVLVTSLLGGWGQRREAERADAAARQASRLAESLTTANAELEERVSQRTEELQFALARQESLVAELAELSVRDSLTGLHNRRHADDELPRLVSSGERYGHPLALAMADLDHFKDVNDRYSYVTGDAVLRAFARILSESARGSDLVARYGGEEFLLVMPETTLEQAGTVCERLRRAVADHPWHEIAPGLRVTVSIGVADTRASAGLVTLVAAADSGLHRAKRAGRNQVVSMPQAIASVESPRSPID